MTALLEVKDLKKAFGSLQAVNGVSFAVEEGDVFGLLGPNGAGKSTTLSIICGLLKANAGSVSIGGHDMAGNGFGAKKLIGIVPQEPALYTQLSATANLRFWGRINGLGGRELDQAVTGSLNLVGLTERAGGRVNSYSGGMKRRLNIAAGLLHNPRLLIMDEPTVGIDPQSRNHILETVKDLKHRGITVIYTSHYVEEVEALCNRVAIMDSGKIIAEGTVEELQKDLAGMVQVRSGARGALCVHPVLSERVRNSWREDAQERPQWLAVHMLLTVAGACVSVCAMCTFHRLPCCRRCGCWGNGWRPGTC